MRRMLSDRYVAAERMRLHGHLLMGNQAVAASQVISETVENHAGGAVSVLSTAADRYLTFSRDDTGEPNMGNDGLRPLPGRRGNQKQAAATRFSTANRMILI